MGGGLKETQAIGDQNTRTSPQKSMPSDASLVQNQGQSRARRRLGERSCFLVETAPVSGLRSRVF